MKKNEEKTNVIRILEQNKINFKVYNYINSTAISGTEVADYLGEDYNIVFKTLVTIIIFISIGIWCLEIYHFNKLYQDARDSIHGYWVEEITEDSRIENE